MRDQHLRLVNDRPTTAADRARDSLIPEPPQSLRADRDLANTILTLDELHAADRIARLQVDASDELQQAISRCDRERCVRALRRLVAIGAMSQILANSIEERT